MNVKFLSFDEQASIGRRVVEPEKPNTINKSRSARVYQLKSSRELICSPVRKPLPYRDAVCSLCEKVVSTVLDVPLSALRARTRMSADIALARQIAMYLAHTTFSMPLTEVGLHFNRDRTTVTHACVVVEDKRDSLSFEITISHLESILFEARNAIDTVLLDDDSMLENEKRNQ